MGDIFVKKGSTRQDDAQFRRTPAWQKAAAMSEEKMSKIVFDSPGAKADYMRRVRANPNNVPGYPVFFPPPLIPTKNYSPNDAYRIEMIAKGIWKECEECGKTFNPKWDHECILQQREAL